MKCRDYNKSGAQRIGSGIHQSHKTHIEYRTDKSTLSIVHKDMGILIDRYNNPLRRNTNIITILQQGSCLLDFSQGN